MDTETIIDFNLINDINYAHLRTFMYYENTMNLFSLLKKEYKDYDFDKVIDFSKIGIQKQKLNVQISKFNQKFLKNATLRVWNVYDCEREATQIILNKNNIKKLTKLKRRLDRKVKGSKRREDARIKQSSFEEHIANARKDWIEKETLRLTKSYKLIGLENLSIKGMMKGSKNAKNYEDISWSTFVNKLIWKGEKNGCHVIKIDKFFPSSQTCSCCGYKNKEVQIKHLERWVCPRCGKEHQRDENAAKNIAAESIKVLREAEESEEKGLDVNLNLSNDTHS